MEGPIIAEFGSLSALNHKARDDEIQASNLQGG